MVTVFFCFRTENIPANVIMSKRISLSTVLEELCSLIDLRVLLYNFSLEWKGNHNLRVVLLPLYIIL